MLKRLVALCVLLLLVDVSIQAAGKEPPRDVLGISIGMSTEAAHSRLQKLGRLEKEERRQQEVWALQRDSDFAYLIVGFDKDQVRYVTAKVREAGRRMRYSDVADIKSARKVIGAGNYEYIWQVAARGNRPAYLVVARGTDPNYLLYYSIKRVN